MNLGQVFAGGPESLRPSSESSQACGEMNGFLHNSHFPTKFGLTKFQAPEFGKAPNPQLGN